MNESGIVENLVTQFSSALDCFRELVQNSIDAGSPQVDVWMEFEQGEGHQGVIAIHVDDFGEGMDENIIDEQLTKLFASTKENDLTKIGKFGIGFVSVFALKPKGVLVHTGRGGEYWEVFFHEDRSFSKTRLDLPVEGTQITLFLEGDYHRHRELVDGVRETLKHWCSHSETEVSFEDRSPIEDDSWGEVEVINESFEVPGECFTTVEHQGTEIAVAYNREPFYGFYNRGLTLAFSRSGEDVLFERAWRYRHIAFKIKSRYLEHTLSRETIMRDENYEKAMKLMDQAVGGQLLEQLIQNIETLVAKESWGHNEVNLYLRWIAFLTHEPPESLEPLGERFICRLVDGRPTTLARMLELWQRDGRLLVSEGQTEMTAALAQDRLPVFYGAKPSAAGLGHVGELFVRYGQLVLGRDWKEQARDVLRWTGITEMLGMPLVKLQARLTAGIVRPEDVYLPVEIDDRVPEELSSLISGAAALLKQADTGYRKFGTGRMVAITSDEAPLFVVAPKLSKIMAIPPKERSKKSRMEVAVNREHPQFLHFTQLAARSPQLANYCLAKALLLDQDRHIERDVVLMEGALRA